MIIYGNDGMQLTFTQEDNRSEIEIDCNGEILVCGGDSNEGMLDLCREELDDLTSYLDKTKSGINRPVDDDAHLEFKDVSTQALIAMENFLKDILGSNSPRRKERLFINKNGHLSMVAKISDVALVVRDSFRAGAVHHVNIATWPHYDAKDNKDPDAWDSWSRIERIELPFDNDPCEIALLMGSYGGGNVTMAYTYDESDSQCFVDDIATMIVNSTGENEDEEVYAEFREDAKEE